MILTTLKVLNELFVMAFHCILLSLILYGCCFGMSANFGKQVEIQVNGLFPR